MQWGNKVVCDFIHFMLFLNQFVLVVLSYFIGGGGFVSAVKSGRALVASSLSRG